MISLACPPFPSSRVTAVRAREAMNELPSWHVELLDDDPEVDLAAAAGQSAILELVDELEGVTRMLDLMIVRAEYHGPERHGHRYSVELSAPAWRLTLRRGYRIVLEKAAHEVVRDVLVEAGFPAGQIELRVAGQTFQRDQITQYAESDWAFVERLLAEEGFSYWFDERDGKCVFVVGDNRGSHDGIHAPVALPFRDDAGATPLARSLRELEVHHELTTGSVHIRDFDVRHPDVYIEGKAGDDPLSHFEYPAFVPDADSAATRAQVRLEQLQRCQVHAGAKSDCQRMQPGRLMRVEGAADDDVNVEYVIISVEHDFREPAPGAQQTRPYSNRVQLAPSEVRPFRPELPRGRPRIDGIERAVTTGPSGEEIHVDDLARVKLRFLWDPSGITDDESSTWARGLQWSLTGSMFLPRVGWEVAVMYLDGSPDRPFVMQRLYNGTAVVPYALPGASATTAIKTVSSPGGGGITEIRLGDDAGAQEMAIHAARDQDVIVGNDATATVGTDRQHDVTLMLASVIEGSHSLGVGAFRTVDVGTDYATTVKGTHLNIIAAAEFQNVGANRVVQTGTYTEAVVGHYALQCNQSNLVTEGNYVNLNVANLRLMAGLSTAENVAGARAERVGGNYIIQASGTFTDNPWGIKRVSAGEGKEKAGGDIGMSAPLGKVKAGTATVKAPEINISGAQVTVKAASLVAEAFELAGGAFKSKDTKIEAAKVRIPAGAKIE